MIVADNVGPHAYATRDYLDYVRGSGRYESRFIPVGRDGMEVSIRSEFSAGELEAEPA